MFVRRLFSSGFRASPSQAQTLTSMGTRRIFSEEHDQIRETARKFFATEVAPFHAKWEAEGQVSRECWEKAGELGLLCSATSEKVGGVGTDMLSAAVVWEEQAYSGCTGPGFALHSDIVAPYLEHFGSKYLQERYIPAMTSGKCITAIAMTEPGAGSDLAGIRTTAVQKGGDWILNGSKTYITNGAMADAVIVVAKTAPEKGAHGITLFMVDAKAPGFTKGRKLKKVGMSAQDTSELFFADVRLPESAIIGELNKGFYYLMQELPQERLLIAAMAACSAEAAWEWTRTHVKDRVAFGAPLAKLQTVRHKLADLKTDLACLRSFIDECLYLHSIKKLDSAMASMAKHKGTNVQGEVIDACLQLHGGAGYMLEYPIARAFVDARVQRIYGGSNEIMLELISRGI